MKKLFKIIGIIVLILVGILFYLGNKRLKKIQIAEEKGNFIIEKLDNDLVLKEFPQNYFPDRELLKGIVKGLKENCDWQNRNGKFVDFLSMKDINGINSAAFIYEYYLTCDSLRFILVFDLDKEKPELFKFDIEPLEMKNEMIIFPEKQLINQ